MGREESITSTQSKGSFRLPKSFFKLWASTGSESFGDYIFETTLVLWIVTNLASGEPWVAQATAGVYVASAIPTLLLGPLAGTYVDRHDARHVNMKACLVSALVIGALAILALGPIQTAIGLDGLPLLALLYLVTIAASALALVMRPASTVLIKTVLPEEDYVRAASYQNVTTNVVMIGGPALASLIFFAVGPSAAFALIAMAFLVSYVLLSRLPADVTSAPEPSGSTVWADIKEGLVFVRRSRPLLALVIGMSMMVFAAGIINSLSIFFLTTNLQASEELFGLFASFQGAGMLAGAAIGVYLVSRIDITKVFWVSLVGIGITIVAFSRQTAYIPGVICIAIVGVFVSIIPLGIGPIMMRSSPTRILGRVGSVMNLLLSLGTILGLGAGGFLYGTIFDDVDFSILMLEFNGLSLLFAFSGLLCMAAGFTVRGLIGSADDLTDSTTEPA